MEEPFTPSFFRRLQQMKIRTRRAFLGSRQGGHRSIRKGHGLEFADYRPYVPGDDFRHIDWGVLGRTDRVYVREFREEQDLNVVVLLDASSSMAYPEGSGKFELARNMAIALSYIALTDGDTVSISALGQKSFPRYVSPRALSRAQKDLLSVTPSESFDLLTEVRAAIDRQRVPGKCFVISDFLIELDAQFAAFDYLRSKNFETCAVQVLAPEELKLRLTAQQLVIDAETGNELELFLDGSSAQEYALQLAAHIEGLERYCASAGVTHVLVSADEALGDVVLGRFTELGILK